MTGLKGDSPPAGLQCDSPDKGLQCDSPDKGLHWWQGALGAALGAVSALVLAGALATAASIGEALVRGTAVEGTSFLVMAASLVGTALGLVGGALLAPLIFRVPVRVALGWRRAPPAAYMATVFGVLSLGPLADFSMTTLARVAPNLTLGVLAEIENASRGVPVWVLFVVLALVPGISEELLFRGLLQRAFGRGARAVLVSGIAFAAFHLDPHQAIGVLPVGLFLAWSTAVTGSIGPTIVAHVANNTLAIFALRVDALRVGFGTDTPMPVWCLPVGLALTALSAIWLRRTAS